ncbi:MAG: arylamine N-acetyltransferase [Bacteroidota bacterium]
MNILAYLQRINYLGDLSPNLATLTQLQMAHMLAVPFENLDIHAGREIRLDTKQIYQKVVEEKRGGFCYELNGLYYDLLLELGYEVRRISARVHSTEQQGYGAEYDHLALIATIDGKEYITDVGYGEFLLCPLVFEIDIEQQDIRGAVYAIRTHKEGYFRIEKRLESSWKPEYIFKPVARDYEEFVPMCNYQQYDPTSYFQKQKLISQLTPNGRVTLTSSKLKILENGKISEREVESAQVFDQLLKTYFSISIPS